ncbi:MAG: DUF2652 domain-containing protein [Saprospiraceae bacterium]
MKHLLETIVQSADDSFVVSEIEGDAVLLYKKGAPPTKKEITDQCVKIFTTFHQQIEAIEGMRICQCVACKGVVKLTLKFVVHYGTISENKIAQFVKASGIDMVIAHRLLKNKINKDEYLLITKNFLNHIPDSDDSLDLEWHPLTENYSSIGKVEFDFAMLDRYRRGIADIPRATLNIAAKALFSTSLEIKADYKDIFAALIDLPSHKIYIDGIKEIEFFIPMSAIGMPHTWVFENYKINVVPKNVEPLENKIIYYEDIRLTEMDLAAGIEYIIEEVKEGQSKLSIVLYPVEGSDLSGDVIMTLTGLFEKTAHNMKEYFERSELAGA